MIKRRILTAVLAILVPIFPAFAQVPGWSYSPLPGEGDRASIGCDREASPERFTCLVVRCADDFSVSVHPYSNRSEPDGVWEVTFDREARQVRAKADETPYRAGFPDDADWLLDRLRNGTFAYLRHEDDANRGFAYIALNGSFRSIAQALYWCAPRTEPVERNALPGVDAEETMEKANEPSTTGAQ